MRLASTRRPPAAGGPPVLRVVLAGEETAEERPHELLRVGHGLRVAREEPLREDLVRRAEDDPDGDARLELLPELSRGDPLLQHPVEDAEVLGELAPREALDEPGAPAQLDLEDRREVAVLPDEGE